MPTGYKTYLDGITINGITYNGTVDLEQVFHARGTAAPAAASGFKTEGDRDLSDLFYPRATSGGRLEADVQFAIADGSDLRQIYAKSGTVGTGGGGGGGCLPYDTQVMLWRDGSKAIGDLRPGDVVIGYYNSGMIDATETGWQDWSMPRAAAASGVFIPVTVRLAFSGHYPDHYLINGQLQATYEHHWLVLRQDAWTWVQTRDLMIGDCFLSSDLLEIPVTSVAHVNEPMRIANIDVEEVDNYLVSVFDDCAVVSHNSDEKV